MCLAPQNIKNERLLHKNDWDLVDARRSTFTPRRSFPAVIASTSRTVSRALGAHAAVKSLGGFRGSLQRLELASI